MDVKRVILLSCVMVFISIMPWIVVELLYMFFSFRNYDCEESLVSLALFELCYFLLWVIITIKIGGKLKICSNIVFNNLFLILSTPYIVFLALGQISLIGIGIYTLLDCINELINKDYFDNYKLLSVILHLALWVSIPNTFYFFKRKKQQVSIQ